MGKLARRGYNCRVRSLRIACLITALCCLSNGGGPGAAPLLDSRRMPPCLVQSAFGKSLPASFHTPGPGEALDWRVLEDYGAMFVVRGAEAPPVVIFPTADSVARWQASVRSQEVEFDGIPVKLQSAAMQSLVKAREEAIHARLNISARGADAAQRDYDGTFRLWQSRLNPGLQHWVGKGLLSAADAGRIRRLPVRQQAAAILGLESRGLHFSKDFSKSILYSVAIPGASQHLALLAFDVKEHDNPAVRSILERHGWFQTVRSDLPHFTYLGVSANELPSLGLKLVREGGRAFWIPNLDCPRN